MGYSKHFIALESNPEIFSRLIHELGVSESVCFHDVLSLSDPEVTAFIPRPALALILVFPTPEDYDDRLAQTNLLEPEQHGPQGDDDDDPLWFKQTINNACGLYAILHAITNGQAKDLIRPDSHLCHLLEQCARLPWSDRATVLENDEKLESIYRSVAVLGDTEAPQNPEDSVDFHYVCFVKSSRDGALYMMDSDRNGPVRHGPFHSDDILSEDGVKIVLEYMRQNEAGDHFSLLALAPS